MINGFIRVLADFAARVRNCTDIHEMLRMTLQCATFCLEPCRSLTLELDLSNGYCQYLEKNDWDDHDTSGLMEALKQYYGELDPLRADGVTVISESLRLSHQDRLLLSRSLLDQGVTGAAAMVIDDPHWHRLYLIILLGDRPRGFDDEEVGFLDAMTQFLATAIGQRRLAEQRDLGLEEVMRIKHELESTVDTLPQLICALNQDGQLTRANRTLETWALGTVQAVRGLSVHGFLHPGCTNPDCQLLESVERAWMNLAEGESTTWELEDSRLGRDLRITLDRAVHLTYRQVDSDSHAVMVVEDIGDHRQLERTREAFKQELQHQLEERTGQLTAANQELRCLSAQRLSWQEAERKRIALELHDGLGQTISEIKFRVESLLQDLRGNASKPPKPTHYEKIGQIVQRLRQGIDEVRRIAMDLRPSTLDDLGLLPTISWFCREFRSTYGDLALQTDIGVDESSIPAPLKIVIFRILQEAMNNIAKHAQASRIVVSLDTDAEILQLRIQDNGRGFSMPADKNAVRGFGLSNMRQRAELSGGELSIHSTPGTGTVVKAWWPLTDGLTVSH